MSFGLCVGRARYVFRRLKVKEKFSLPESSINEFPSYMSLENIIGNEYSFKS